MGAIRILLADDHELVRTGIRNLLQDEADMTVVGEASNGCEAIEVAVATRPDVAVVDLAMPGQSGVDVIRELRERCPEIRCLALTGHEGRSHLRAVLAAGGAGYVAKSAAHTELLRAIRAVYEGRSYIDTALSDDESDLEALLSEREREVLRLVALGYTNREAADQLGLSVKSIEAYRARVKEKLGVDSRAALVKFAIEQGLLEDDGGG